MRDLKTKNWRELIRSKTIVIEEDSRTNFYGKFVCEPLERGFGITIGNSLRRILLSSLQGSAIVSVSFDDVVHEFTALPGVIEDVTDIILNLKEIKLKLIDVEKAVVYLSREGEGDITAGDIETDGSVEILNPEQHIATLDKEGKLNMEMVVRTGKGYIPAERSKSKNQPIGVIPIDAFFSPVQKVNHVVTNARVGQITDYDKLTLEVWTDGSVLPEDALAFAGKILKEQMTPFINFEEGPEPIEEEDEEEELVVFARFVYPLEGKPASISFTPPMNEAGFPAAEIGFLVYHRGLPVNDFRYLGTTETLNLDCQSKLFTICLECNQPLEGKSKQQVQGRVPHFVFQTRNQYVECPTCHRIYWRGTHWQAMTTCAGIL